MFLGQKEAGITYTNFSGGGGDENIMPSWLLWKFEW